MTDYISRQAAMKLIEEDIPITLNPIEVVANILAELEGVPSADVVEVVRCKDCKHYKRNIPCVGGHYNGCDEWIDEGNAITVYDNDFCSYGERADK